MHCHKVSDRLRFVAFRSNVCTVGCDPAEKSERRFCHWAPLRSHSALFRTT
jgi:hypothetical protein